MAYSGLFELRTPRDLLGKLRHDLERMEKDPLDARPAFDFFVTAHHMHVDWLPGRHSKERKRYEHDQVAVALLAVCSHLANGSKHFQADPNRHDSVKDTKLHEGAFSDQFQADAFDTSRLEVHLDGNAAKELGSVVLVMELARQVLAFWEGHPNLR